jgi:hypothetical protein
MLTSVCWRKRAPIWLLLTFALTPLSVQARVVVFRQEGFPTVASDPVKFASLEKALANLDSEAGSSPVCADESMLRSGAPLTGASLLVLPYGSAFPVDAWKAIEAYLGAGGNLLLLGGQAFRVPVSVADGHFTAGREQDTYSRMVGFRHTYKVPVDKDAAFEWKAGYDWLPSLRIEARRFFTLEGRLDGFGYMASAAGELQAAPVVVANAWNAQERRITGGRIVALDFDPVPGYWETNDGV